MENNYIYLYDLNEGRMCKLIEIKQENVQRLIISNDFKVILIKKSEMKVNFFFNIRFFMKMD
jgi:hypothetical protein